jgi:hypothetical protein
MDPTMIAVFTAMEMLKMAREHLLANAPTAETTPETAAAYEALKPILQAASEDMNARVARNLARAGLAAAEPPPPQPE